MHCDEVGQMSDGEREELFSHLVRQVPECMRVETLARLRQIAEQAQPENT